MRKWLRLAVSIGVDLLTGGHQAKKYNKDLSKYTFKERADYYRWKIRRVNKRGFHAQFIIKGDEKLPKGQCLFVGNHTSNADPILMLAILYRPLTFLAKKEIKKFPIIGQIVTSLEGSYLDREDLRSEIKTVKHAIETLENNKDVSFLAYPEGTRSHGPDFKVATFHSGTFKIATRLSLPVVPVVMYNCERIFDQHYHYHRYPVQVTFLDPIYEEEYSNWTTAELASYCQKEVEEELVKQKERDRELVKTVNNYSDKKTDKVLLNKSNKKY